MGRRTTRQGRKLEQWLLIGGLLAVCALACALWLGAAAVDRIARGWEEEQLANGIASRVAELEASHVAIVSWDDSVEYIQNHYDADWVRSNFGAYFTTTGGFQQVFVLGADDKPVLAVQGEADMGPAQYALYQPTIARLVERVRRLEARRGPIRRPRTFDKVISVPIQASGAETIAGRPVILTASLVQPDFGKVVPNGPRAAIGVTGRVMDEDFVAEMARRYQIGHAHLAPPQSPRLRGEAETVIDDLEGRPLVALRWDPRRPGDALLHQVGWVLAAAFAIIFAGILMTQRAARKAFSELQNKEAALRLALGRAETADRAKSEFLASMSHEIRTPLNSVFGALHLLRDEPISDGGRMLVDNALASGQMVNALINDVLDYSKLADGAMSLSPEAADLRPLFASAHAAFAPHCTANGVALHLDVPEDLGWAHVDELRLRQCLFNLVGNAVKFTAAGQVSVRARRDGERLRVSVRDTGVGIPAEALPTLFDRFTQGDGSTTRRFGGTGLGLAITQRIAGMMGGGVEVQSRLGEGSTFTLTIVAPACAPVESAEPGAEAAGPLAGAAFLLVDDNPSNLVIGYRLLERLGASVVTADSAAAALEAAREQVFDMVLMDIQMPEVDGMEATRRLRRSGGPNADAPVIALTANVLESQRAAYREAGMDGVVDKPISPAELLREIMRVAADAEQPEAA